MRFAVLAVLGLLVCCKQHENREPPPRETPRPQRALKPPSDPVGSLPPYAIRGDAVGPYKLGEKLSDLLEQLASGPRIELFEIAGVVHRSVIRAEEDTLLIGGEQASTASFVAVISGDVARTESGVHVGSTRDELLSALGAPVDAPERVRDPRLVVPGNLPGLRAVLDGEHIAALVVAAAPAAQRSQPACTRPPAGDRGMSACLTPAGEQILTDGDEIAIRSADGEKALVAPFKVPGLMFAAPLRVIGEARDELVVVSRSEDAAARTWSVVAYRLDGTRLSRTVEPTPVYQLSVANARWIGAELRDVELYLELTGRVDGIDVGGLLVTRSAPKAATKFRDVVVISPASVTRRRAKSAPVEPGDAGVAPAPASPSHVTQDAAADASDSASAPDAPSKP